MVVSLSFCFRSDEFGSKTLLLGNGILGPCNRLANHLDLIARTAKIVAQRLRRVGLCETCAFKFSAPSLGLGKLLLGGVKLANNIQFGSEFEAIHERPNLLHGLALASLLIKNTHQLSFELAETLGMQTGKEPHRVLALPSPNGIF
jgi:hypothetical protein